MFRSFCALYFIKYVLPRLPLLLNWAEWGRWQARFLPGESPFWLLSGKTASLTGQGRRTIPQEKPEEEGADWLRRRLSPGLCCMLSFGFCILAYGWVSWIFDHLCVLKQISCSLMASGPCLSSQLGRLLTFLQAESQLPRALPSNKCNDCWVLNGGFSLIHSPEQPDHF